MPFMHTIVRLLRTVCDSATCKDSLIVPKNASSLAAFSRRLRFVTIRPLFPQHRHAGDYIRLANSFAIHFFGGAKVVTQFNMLLRFYADPPDSPVDSQFARRIAFVDCNFLLMVVIDNPDQFTRFSRWYQFDWHFFFLSKHISELCF